MCPSPMRMANATSFPNPFLESRSLCNFLAKEDTQTRRITYDSIGGHSRKRATHPISHVCIEPAYSLGLILAFGLSSGPS